ncbi:MAG: C40 family peptidase [Polyangiaceae bacterium]|nr:C40 family peptidase [Polyangiaceae bacterium]
MIARRIVSAASTTLALSLAIACASFDPADRENAPGSEAEPTATVEQAVTAGMSRAEIIALAQTGVGYSYWWGRDQWDPTEKKFLGSCSGSCPKCSHSATGGGPEYGADCSGYVAKVWQVPGPTPIPKYSHPYSTSHFRWNEIHWKRIARADLQPADALVYRNAANTGGHIVLFDRWTSAGSAMVYECAGCSTGCRYGSKTLGSAYVAIRRNGVDDAPASNARGYLDSAGCSNIEGWAFDDDAGAGAIEVVLTFDGPIDKEHSLKVTTKAELPRADLCKVLGSCDHGYSVPFPSSLRDGKNHSVYAYAIDPETKEPQQLVGAPRTVSCSCGSSPVPGAESEPFRDMPPGSFAHDEAIALLDAGITQGCSSEPPLYCASCSITREQLVTMLVRAAGLSPLTPAKPTFSDVAPSSPSYGAIEAAAAAGWTSGCGNGRFCPSEPANRASAAALVRRAAGLNLVTTTEPSFDDVPAGSWLYQEIETLAAYCITQGCSSTEYCPGRATTRAEAAIFIARAFQLVPIPDCKKGAAGCAHSPCKVGAPLNVGCSSCANMVCIQKPSCCDPSGTWDQGCVELAGDSPGACASECADGQSSCSHSECEAGSALPTGCSSCAASVCAKDAYCCSGAWDWICAKAAKADPYCSCGSN